MGNEESQLLQGGAGSNDPFRPMQSMNSNFGGQQQQQQQKPFGGTNSVLNSIGQLSNSFPNSIKPMNQLINQLNPGSFQGQTGSGGGLGGGGGGSNVGGLLGQRTGPGPGPPGGGGPHGMAPSATSAANSANPQVPEVDLSGLTEEEKMMIQSVMARAQEETAGPVVTPVIKSNATPSKSSIGQPNTSLSNNANSASGPLSMSAKPAAPAPIIGYPEQRRMLNKTQCSSCQRDQDQMTGIKCADCTRLFCVQCSTSHIAPDGQSQIWTCVECAKRRKAMPPSLVPASSSSMTSNGAMGGGSQQQQPFGSNQPNQQQSTQPLMSNSSFGQQQQSGTSSALMQQGLTAQSQFDQQQQQYSSNLSQSYGDPQSSMMPQQQQQQMQGPFGGPGSSNNAMQPQQDPSMGGQFMSQNSMSSLYGPDSGAQSMGASNQQQAAQQQQQFGSAADPRSSIDQSDPFAALMLPPPAASSSALNNQQQQQIFSSNANQSVLSQGQSNAMHQAPSQQQQQQSTSGLDGLMAAQQSLLGTAGQSSMYGPQLGGMQSVPKCQIIPPSVAANNEADDYGYLDFEIDEEYERQGEYDEEDDDEEDELMEEDDEDIEEMASQRYGARKEVTFAQKSILKNAQEYGSRQGGQQQQAQQLGQSQQQPQPQPQPHAQQPGGPGKQVQAQQRGQVQASFNHPYYGYHSSVNDVYTIPEEDEDRESEQDQADHYHAAAQSGRKQSVAGKVVRHQLPDPNFVASQMPQQALKSQPVQQQQQAQFHPQQQQPLPLASHSLNMSKIFRVPGPIQRILPSTSANVTTSTRQAVSCSAANSSAKSNTANSNSPMARIINESTSKARSIRSNSEPFLQMIKPFRRGIFESSNSLPQQLAPPGSQAAQLQQQQMQANSMMGANQFQQMTSDLSQSDSAFKQQQQQQQQQRQLQSQSSLEQLAYNQSLGQMGLMQQDLNMASQQGFMGPNVSNAAMYGNQVAGGMNSLSNLNSSMSQGGPLQQQGGLANSMASANNWSMMPQDGSLQMQGANQRQAMKQQQLGATSQPQTSYNQSLQQQQRMQQEQYGQFASGLYEPGRPNEAHSMINEASNLYGSGLQGLEPVDNYSMPRSMPLYNMSTQFSSMSSAPSSMGPTQSQSGHFAATSTTVSSHSVLPTLTTAQLGRTQNLSTLQPNSQGSLSTASTNRAQQQQQLSQQALMAKSQLQQFSDSAWAHATELSPILDVSPSVEAAEAQEIIERRSRSLDREINGSSGASLGIPRATSGTISAMMDDFNRTIEQLDLNHNPDLMESNIRQNRALQRDSQTTAKSAVGQATTVGGKHGALPRRASTGQMDSLDLLGESRALKQQQQLSNKSNQAAATASAFSQPSATAVPPSSQQAGPNVEALRQTKALMATNSAIEQQLQKQQQILIQQQQQFLQIQLEQQRLQSQMHEQLQQQKAEEQQKMNSEPLVTTQSRDGSIPIYRPGSALDGRHRETSVAVNTEQDLYERSRRDKSVTMVMKQDKQVSTTPPSSSINSTPTGQPNRSISQVGQQPSTGASSRMSGAVDSDPMRPRVASASSSSSSMHGRRSLPQAVDDQPCPMPTSVTGYHHQQQQGHNRQPSSVTAISISQPGGAGSPLLARKQQQSSAAIKSAIAKAAMPSAGVSAVSSYPSSILIKKDGTSTTAGRTAIGTNSSTLNTLGYLDLDTKNVTFEADKGKRRRLPTVPKDEEPITSSIATRKLIKERLSAGKGLPNRNPPLKSSSSLDSSFGIGPFCGPSRHNRPQSPFSTNSDISQFLASTYGRNILKSPSGSGLADALKSLAAKDSKTAAASGLLSKYSSDDSKLMSSSNFANEIKNIQQKIIDELKAGGDLHSGSNLAMLNSLKGSTMSDPLSGRQSVLPSTVTAYGGLAKTSSPFTLTNSKSRNFYGELDRFGRRLNSDTRLGSLDRFVSKAGLPFKSYEYESLNPVRYSNDKYRLMRPMSSLSASFGENDLRESVIPNYMNNENDLFLRSSLFDRKAHFDEKGLLSDSKYDRFNALYSKYDLATGLGTSSNRFSRHLYGRTNPSRSWHPSPQVSDLSDEEPDPIRSLDQELSIEEKAAKVRAEIKRRRARMGDSGRLYRHYSLDDYNIDNYTADYDPLLSDTLHDSYDLATDAYRDSKYLGSDYPLSSAKEKYYSDDLDAYFSKSSGFNSYDYRDRDARNNARLYDSRLSGQNPPFIPPKEYPPPPPPNAYGTSTMPLLNDTSSRVRPKMPDDLGPAGINGTGYRSGGYDLYDYNYMRGSPKKTQFAPNTTKYPKYPFPIKRILLTQDPKIRSMGGDGLGLKVVGGKDIPGTNMIGAYIQKIHPSLSMNEIREGMQVIEWNGIPLTGISHDEVSRIIANQVGDEIEVVIRTDINLLSDQFGYPGPGPSGPMGASYGGGPPPPSGPPYGQPASYGYGPEGGMPPPSNYYSQQSQHMMAAGQGMPPPPPGNYQGPMGSMPPSSMHMGTAHHGGPMQQPQVILQHNHPVEDPYDQYSKMNHPPPGMAPPGQSHHGMMAPPPSAGHQHGHMQQHGPTSMPPPPGSHQHPMDSQYYGPH